MFGLNIYMQVESEKDFHELRQYVNRYYKRFPMFRHDIVTIENIIEDHIKHYSISMVKYRQSKSKIYLENAQKEIEEINRVLSTVGKLELMALLSQG